MQLEQTLEQEQECLVNKLMRKIEKLEAETHVKQNNLEQLRREKVELENTLEQEQEALVNKLWKRMDKLEAEKRHVSSPSSLFFCFLVSLWTTGTCKLNWTSRFQLRPLRETTVTTGARQALQHPSN